MIKNERQYRITKALAASFERALSDPSIENANERLDPLLVAAEKEALASQLRDLHADLAEYEALQAGKRSVLEVESFDQLPHALIKARIALGLTQKDLAERVGLKEQQIQRYEATDYASASLSRINRIVEALGLTVRKQVYLPDRGLSPRTILARLESVGIDRDLLFRRLLPPAEGASLRSAIQQKKPSEGLLLQAIATVERVFRLPLGSLLEGKRPVLDLAVAGLARFKVPAGADARRLAAYTVYAHHLALIVLEATRDLPQRPPPRDPVRLGTLVRSEHGELGFAALLTYTWDLGIPVLPLKDAGAFHGACWRIGGRNIVVLKQSTASDARWAFDLLHELDHAGSAPDSPEFAIVEEPIAERIRSSEGERAASRYAGDALLGGRAEQLAEECVEAARGSVERLKSVVPIVADKAGVGADVLANYLAFRLSLQDINWWGVAANLQPASTPQPWQVARDMLLRRADLGALNESDRILLTNAVSE